MKIEEMGNNIRKLREENNLTQDELADKLFVSRGAISKWECNKSSPDVETLKKLASIFNVSVETLFTGEETLKEDLTLKLYEEKNRDKKKLKIFTGIIILLLISLLIFLGYYFINQYNTTKIYNITGDNYNFSIDGGMYITTKERSYFYIGNIISNNGIEIKKVELYYNDNQEELLTGVSDNHIFLVDFQGYQGNLKDKKDIENKLFLKIYYDDTYEFLKVKLTLEYENSNLFYKKYKNIGKADKLIFDTNDYILKIKKQFKLVDDVYIYEGTYNNYNVSINYMELSNLITICLNNNILEKWYIYNISLDNIDYYTIEDEIPGKHLNDESCNSQKCDNEELKSKYVELFEILNTILK